MNHEPYSSVRHSWEADFWAQIKRQLARSVRKVNPLRIEAVLPLGFPDIMLCDERRLFHFIELKVTHGSSLALSPNQVSWHTKYGGASVWILVKRFLNEEKVEFLLFPGALARDLTENGSLSTKRPSWKSDKINIEEILGKVAPLPKKRKEKK